MFLEDECIQESHPASVIKRNGARTTSRDILDEVRIPTRSRRMQELPRRRRLPETDTDQEMTILVRPRKPATYQPPEPWNRIPQRAGQAQRPQRRAPGPTPSEMRQNVLMVGGMLTTALIIWCGACFVVNVVALNVTDRWNHGPDSTTVLSAPFHTTDSAHSSHYIASITPDGKVILTELQGDDPGRGKIYTGPDLKASGIDYSHAVIDLQVRGNQLIATTNYGGYSLWFQRDHKVWVLTSTPDGFTSVHD